MQMIQNFMDDFHYSAMDSINPIAENLLGLGTNEGGFLTKAPLEPQILVFKSKTDFYRTSTR